MLTVKIESFLQKKGEETSLHYAPVKKVALTKTFGLQFEHIRVNTQNVMSFVKFIWLLNIAFIGLYSSKSYAYWTVHHCDS